MKVKTMLVALAAVMVLAWLPGSASAATCADYSTQAQAQRAADTRDADRDGIYCESLPCPCSTGSGATTAPPPAPPAPPASATPSCSRPAGVQRLLFSTARYPNIKSHTEAAIAKGWPRILVLNRPDADKRRDRLLEQSGLTPRPDQDRDEYPPAVGRGRANGTLNGLVRGTNPIGWMADVMYVPDHENQSHGTSLGAKLRRFCNGTRFRYVFG
jgi:hypothetical protein